MLPIFVTKLSAETSYGVVVDAGSTGTRTFIYQWNDNDDYPDVQPAPNSQSPWSLSFDIPLAMAETNDDIIPSIFSRILDFVKPKVEKSKTETPIYVYATGGMRLIPVKAQEKIISETYKYIEKHSQLKLKKDAVKIISGSDEGYYGWVAINHLAHTFNKGKASIGALDFGGASSQIAAQSTEKGDEIIEADINNSHQNVFSHSFLGFGINELMDSVQDYLKSLLKKETRIINPCQFKNHSETIENITFIGDGNYEKCFEIVDLLFINSQEFKNIKIPKLTSRTYHGLGGFTYFNSFVELPDNSTLAQTKEKAIELCSKDWEYVKSKDPNNSHIWQYCLSGVFQEALLTKGYHFSDENTTIIKSSSINNVQVSWTLGALVSGLSENDNNFPTIYIILIVIVTILVIVAIIVIIIRLIKRKKDEEAYEALNSTSLLGPW